MAEWGKGIDWSLKSNQDLSAKRYRFVTISGSADQTIALHTVSGGLAIGVLQTKATTYQHGTVRVMGITKVVAGATISAGDILISTASGEAIRTTSGANTQAMGIALSGVASGGIATMMLVPGGRI